MTVDHKAIREAAEVDGEVTLTLEQIRQLLDENQALKDQRDRAINTAKISQQQKEIALNSHYHLEEQFQAQAKEIERLEIALHTYKSCDKSAVDLYYENQEQAKEIERLKQEHREMNISALSIKAEAVDTGNKLLEIANYSLEAAISKNKQLQADKAAAVELIRKIRDMTPYGLYHEMIDPVLQRIESGDKE